MEGRPSMKFLKKLEKNHSPNSITSIPLSSKSPNVVEHDNLFTHINGAIGNLRQIFRSEISLAKTEIFTEVKNGFRGSIFFITAAVILLYSSFFFFLTLGFALYEFLPLWLSFLIIFLVMVLVAVLLIVFGVLKVKKIRKPESTISTLKSTASIPSSAKQHQG